MSQAHEPMKQGGIALIALGSNATSPWGTAFETVQEACARTHRALRGAVTRSRFFQTPAFPAGAGPDFVNAAVAVETVLDAGDVLARLHGIEAAADRTRETRWGQRTLDLDLIALGDQVLPDKATHALWRDLPLAQQKTDTPDQLILPHPRLQDRAFVLVPLADVAPDWRHPVLQLTVVEMLAQCDPVDRTAVLPLDAHGNLLVNQPPSP